MAVEETGGPKIPFRVGRSDAVDGSTSPPDGRLPDADKGSHVATRQHIRDIFYRMGESCSTLVNARYTVDREILAAAVSNPFTLLHFTRDRVQRPRNCGAEWSPRHGPLPHGPFGILGTLDECRKYIFE